MSRTSGTVRDALCSPAGQKQAAPLMPASCEWLPVCHDRLEVGRSRPGPHIVVTASRRRPSNPLATREQLAYPHTHFSCSTRLRIEFVGVSLWSIQSLAHYGSEPLGSVARWAGRRKRRSSCNSASLSTVQP